MFKWLYFLESDEDFHKLLDLIDNADDIDGKHYRLFHDKVKCIDGRVFHNDNNILVTVNFHTYSSDLRERIVKHGLNPASLIDFYDIECNDCDSLAKPYIIIEGTTCIICENELVKYLAERQYRFKDGSNLTIPDAELYRWKDYERQRLGL